MILTKTNGICMMMGAQCERMWWVRVILKPMANTNLTVLSDTAEVIFSFNKIVVERYLFGSMYWLAVWSFR